MKASYYIESVYVATNNRGHRPQDRNGSITIAIFYGATMYHEPCHFSSPDSLTRKLVSSFIESVTWISLTDL